MSETKWRYQESGWYEGVWIVVGEKSGGVIVKGINNEQRAALIASAPDLKRELEQMTQARDGLIEAMRDIQEASTQPGNMSIWNMCDTALAIADKDYTS